MKKKATVYDRDLGLEAYRFQGIAQPFPNHFHEHYVIGLMEGGQRTLSCKGREYAVGPGSVLLFGPGDAHACAQRGGEMLDYRGLSVSRASMLRWTDRRKLPGFSANAVQDGALAHALRKLHELVMDGAESFEKEEALLLLLSGLLRKYGQTAAPVVPDCRREAEQARTFLEERYAERISLDQICGYVGLSKSTLLRSFARAWGVTPYRYLESLRINAAQRLLAQGMSLPETALRAGFFDQSHFTNCFTRLTGLSPGLYRDMFRDKAEGFTKEE